MITCKEACDSITDEREGALSGVRGLRYRMHMLVCRHCRAYRRQIGVVIEAVKDAPAEAVPPEIEARLVDAFRRKRAPRE